MNRSTLFKTIAVTGVTALMTVLGCVVVESIHDSSRKAIPQGWLSRVTGSSPSSKDIGIQDCNHANAANENNANPPLPYVAYQDCQDLDDMGNYKNEDHPCIKCPVLVTSRKAGGAVQKGGIVQVSNQNCGDGVPPFSAGEKGICYDGLCINRQPYVCNPLAIYQGQSGPPGG